MISDIEISWWCDEIFAEVTKGNTNITNKYKCQDLLIFNFIAVFFNSITNIFKNFYIIRLICCQLWCLRLGCGTVG